MARARGSGVDLSVIANANPVYVRDDEREGNFAELVDDMRDRALLVPILVLPDYQIIDGARRFEAAKYLGWEDIPTIATRSWETIRDIFLKARKAEANGAPYRPMRWLEYSEIRRDILFQIYNQQVTIPTRLASKKAGTQKEGSAADLDFGELFGMDANSARACNALSAALNLVAKRTPERYQEAVGIIRKAEDEGGTIHHAIHLLKRLTGGLLPTPVEVDRTKAEAQLRALERALPTLEGMALEIGKVAPLNGGVTEEEARSIHNRLLAVSRYLTPLRQSLQGVLHQEREKQADE